MKIVGRVIGSVGVIILLSTILTYLALGAEGKYFILGKLLLSIAAIAFYIFTNAEDFGKTFKSRYSAYLSLTIVFGLIILVLLVALNFIAVRNPFLSKERDLTADKIFELSDQTKKTIRNLDAEVDIKAFFGQMEEAAERLAELLTRYRNESGNKIKFSLVNPWENPEEVRQYNIKESGPRIVLVKGGREARAKDPTEEGITKALIEVSKGKAKKIYFTIGHGEKDTADKQQAEGFGAAAELLRDEGYETLPLQLLLTETIADDASAVIIASPEKPLLQTETETLAKYMNEGGRVMVMLEPFVDGGLDKFLKDWNVEVGGDIALELNPIGKLFGFGPTTPVIMQYDKSHDITKNFTVASIFHTARSLNPVASGGASGVTAKTLASTSDNSWGETKLEGTSAKFDDGVDKKGPLPVFVVASKPNAGGKRGDEIRLAVFGDFHFACNKFLGIQGNADLFANTVGWLAQAEEKISIRPKQRKSSRLFMTGGQNISLAFFSLDVLPVLLTALGIVVWQLRRGK